MRVSGKWMIGVWACAGLLARVETAAACGSTPCAFLQDVQPAEGTIGVPVDSEVRVRYFGTLDPAPLECGKELAKIRLQAEGGAAPLELDAELLSLPERAEGWFVAKPPEPLLMNTRYDVYLDVLRGDACTCESDWTSVSSFTTAAEADVRAPERLELPELSYGERQTGTSNCGTTDLIPLTPELESISDDFPGARYNVYIDGALAGPYRESVVADDEGAPAIYLDCGTGALTHSVLVRPGANLEIRAVDLAGNESPPGDSVRVLDRCSASSDVESSGGCSLSVVRGGTGAAWLFALLAVLAAHEARAIKRRSLARKTSSPGDNASARSMTLRSSRTLPGQS
jgi:hypothetical protein